MSLSGILRISLQYAFFFFLILHCDFASFTPIKNRNIYICTCDSLWCCLFYWQTPAVTNPSKLKITRKLQCPLIVHMSLGTRTTRSTSAEAACAPHVCSRRYLPLPASKAEGSGFKMTRGWRHSKRRLSTWPKQILGSTCVASTETPAWMFSLLLTCKSKVRKNGSTSSYWSKPLLYTC